jgi:quinolinate synthase
VPITYINSSAAVKSFVGEHGGAVCTSSNCRRVLEWALAGGAAGTNGPWAGASSAGPSDIKVLFLPDQHLGRNTAYDMGFALDKMVVWDPTLDLGGNTAEALARCQFILWKGHCSVHQLFRPEHIEQVRQRYPRMKVIVHPECRWEVVRGADLSGSTSMIVRTIDAAPPGSQWAVGTEVHLVNRLARQHPEQKIIVLSDCQCLCTTMFRIDLPHLCWVLEELVKGNVVNRIQVDDHTRKWATVALERMLTITAGATAKA